ncbi:hypothetical protein FA13DRAFT_1791047 [Coprinellus micaceus]|uniref:Uncharacterized protein n=1 Tax=Coprinellus micaceus TaxID=71717 RepID=A0A4Y7TDI5_COPMI|nr:hypothetical protein FA13DRAFT_1791047 [Coprinellus micaceus]
MNPANPATNPNMPIEKIDTQATAPTASDSNSHAPAIDHGTKRPADATDDKANTQTGQKRASDDAGQNPRGGKVHDVKDTPQARRIFDRNPIGWPDKTLLEGAQAAKGEGSPSPSRKARRKAAKKKKEEEDAKKAEEKMDEDAEMEDPPEDNPIPQPNFTSPPPPQQQRRSEGPASATTKVNTTHNSDDGDEDEEMFDEESYNGREEYFGNLARPSESGDTSETESEATFFRPAEVLPRVTPSLRSDTNLTPENTPKIDIPFGIIKAGTRDSDLELFDHDPDSPSYTVYEMACHPGKNAVTRMNNLSTEVYGVLEHDRAIIAEVRPDRKKMVQELGPVEGTLPLFHMVLGITKLEKAKGLARPVVNTAVRSLVNKPNPWEPTHFAAYLSGIGHIPATETYRLRIENAIRDEFESHPAILTCLDKNHKGLGINKNDYTRDEAAHLLTKNLEVRFVKHPNGGGTWWTLHWTKNPANTYQGELDWILTIRKIKIEVKFVGTINTKPPHFHLCGICHAIDHTGEYCPFPTLDGWHKIATENGGGANRGRGGYRGGRGQGGRGQGRGRGHGI